MEYTIFHNRKKELEFLDSLYSDKKQKLLIAYGRRRVGKTAILKTQD